MKGMKQIAPFSFRCDPALKLLIQQMAKQNRRSVNSEINALLESALNEKASTVGAVEAHESTLNTQSKGDCNGNYSK
ncbi:Arc family DNA-binding protein [Shewanella oncorhynchi]|uniref:Arc family DNA-binding protein n=1 Tax=Shewanella TaxID=22 RepID=UPI0021DA6A29|nr:MULTISPECIES: Arc family DNA-binding protein [unclassified Shewanella]MCU7965174.1 Arc family DNA-binding protein [Shewanella sp. SW32]MCU7973164.1 Arc family DNA-binding protein [Shewanella sp. SW29]MCU8036925.1 Arc family DNA-binding protein [Shewanella sp. SM69]